MRTAQQFNENLRKEIRNRQKQQYFRKIRQQIYQQSLRSRNQQSSMISNTQYQCQQQSQQQKYNAKNKFSLNFMKNQVNSNNISIINKLLQYNVHQDLMQNIKKGILLQQTFQLLASIFSKQKIKISNRFVQKGLIQQLKRYTENGSNFMSICLNIISNIIYQDKQNAQLMLQENIHRHLIQLLQKIIISKHKQNITKQQYDIGYQILYALTNLCQIQSTITYKQQFIQILKFAIELYQKYHIYDKLIIQIIFLVGYQYRQQTQNLSTATLQQILNQISSESQNLKQLLITIKLLSPININYNKISSLICIIHPYNVSYALRILQRIVTIYPAAIPKDMIWWERIYLKLLKSQCKQVYISLLKKSKIKAQWIYNIIKEILENNYMNITLINSTLLFINSLIQESNNMEEKRNVKYNIKNHGINNQLMKLYEHKNYDISRNSQFLLIAINNQ